MFGKCYGSIISCIHIFYMHVFFYTIWKWWIRINDLCLYYIHRSIFLLFLSNNLLYFLENIWWRLLKCIYFERDVVDWWCDRKKEIKRLTTGGPSTRRIGTTKNDILWSYLIRKNMLKCVIVIAKSKLKFWRYFFLKKTYCFIFVKKTNCQTFARDM